MAQHQINYRKTLRSALANKKLADSFIDSIYDLQAFAVANGGAIDTLIIDPAITRSTETPYGLSNTTGAYGTVSSMRKALRASLNNRALADNMLNIILELQNYAGTLDKQLTSITTIADVVGVAEATQIACVADIAAVAEVTRIVCTADVAGSLDGKYFILYDDVGSVAFWYDVDDNGTAAPVHGAARAVEITTITTGMTAAQVGDATYTAVCADSKFDAHANDGAGTIDVVASTVGAKTAGTAGDSGFTVSVHVLGVTANSLDGKYFTLYDELGSVAFWYDVDNNGTAAPVHGATRAVEITTITTGMTAAQVGDATYTAVCADTKFDIHANAGAGTIIVESSTFGPKTNGSAGTSGFAVTEHLAGVTEVSLNGRTVILEDADGTVGFWLDVAGGTLIPAAASGADRAVEITTVTAGMTAAQVGDAIYTAIVADSEFEAGTNDNAGHLVIQNTEAGYFPNVSASTSGFTVAVSDGGSAAATQDKMVTQSVTANKTPYTTSNVRALTIGLCHAALASDIIAMILELQTEFRDHLLGTCTGTLTNDLITV